MCHQQFRLNSEAGTELKNYFVSSGASRGRICADCATWWHKLSIQKSEAPRLDGRSQPGLLCCKLGRFWGVNRSTRDYRRLGIGQICHTTLPSCADYKRQLRESA